MVGYQPRSPHCRNKAVNSELPDITPPAITAFSLPLAAASTTVAISTFTANDDVGVTGYFLSDSPAVPSADASGWSATLYAWAKDAAGNISATASASVTIAAN